MSRSQTGEGQSRRDWLISASAASLLAGLLPSAGAPLAQEPANGWEAVVRQVLGEATPSDGKLTIDLPEIAENGNTVPFSIGVDSPMTEASHVKSIYILATANPQPVISTFHFTPASGRAAVSGRLRLAQSQRIVALAALSDGRFIMARREVKVTIGGCGG